MNMWKRTAAIGIVFGMLTASMPILTFAGDIFVENDLAISAEYETEAEVNLGSDVIIEDIFDESIITEDDGPRINEDMIDIFSVKSETDLLGADDDELIDSGECGVNLTWTLNANMLLCIRGSGAMKDYSIPAQVPWMKYNSEVQSIDFSDDITHIGDNAFYFFKKLEDIRFPKNLQSIGENSFADAGIKKVEIPYGTVSIGESAFIGTNLEIVSIPRTIKRIGAYAFSANYIGTTIFDGSFEEWARINFGSYQASPAATSCNLFINNEPVTKVELKSTNISRFAFYHIASLTDVKLAPGTKEIIRSQFSECEGLTKISFPNTVTEIGDSAFFGCAKLKEILIPDGVKNIYESTFSYCSSLEYIALPSSVETIGDRAFSYCRNLDYVVMPPSVSSISDDAFNKAGKGGVLTMYGESNSYAEKYANNHENMLFKDHYYEDTVVEPTCVMIDTVVMDPETLDMTYLAPDDSKVDKTSLSAGEKQLMVIAILWALARCSNKKLPVIIDTPLSRLDSAHRESLIKIYFPQASEQTIILSTDSEINHEYYDMMKPFISDEFLLRYDDSKKSTTVSHGYFTGDES